MAAVPSIARASGLEGAHAPEADLTRALYEQYANQIFRYCLHQLGSREEAEDAVQSTFLNAFRGIKRGILPEIESAWLFKIAHNVCLSRRRSTWRRGRIESPADFDIVEEIAPAPSRRADELIGLQDVLEQIPEQQRRAILLREWQGLSYREIAEELQVSQAAVETLIFRARRSLAQGLEQPVEVRERRRSVRAAGALGNLLASAQSFLLGGGAAVKVAATVAVVGAGTVVATAPVHVQPRVKPVVPAGTATHSKARQRQSGTSGVATVPPALAGGVQRVVAPSRARRANHVTAAPSAPLVTLTTSRAKPATVPAAAPAATPPATAEEQPVPAQPEAAAPAQEAQRPVAAKEKRAERKADAARAVTPAQTPAATPQGPPSTPRGQAKKDGTPAAAAPPTTPPPGRRKKSNETAATPDPAATPPGQAKHDSAPPPSQTSGNGKSK